MIWFTLSVVVVCAAVLVGYRWRLDASVPTIEVAASGVVESQVRESVIVTLKSGDAFRGVLFEHDDRALVLRNAVALSAATQTMQPVDGELVVLWVDVAYLQRP